MGRSGKTAAAAGLAVLVLTAGVAAALAQPGASAGASVPAPGIHKIRHVVVIMQENRSFDSYFGTFPGARGIPPGVCVPDPASGGCVGPFHDRRDMNAGGPHGAPSAIADIDGGKMDGFVAQQEQAKKNCQTKFNPACGSGG